MAIRAAAEAGITVAANPNRVEVRVDGLVIADSTRALVLRAPGTPVFSTCREPMWTCRDSSVRSAPRTVPYKGHASYWSIQTGRRVVNDAVWSYEVPYPDMAAIAGHLAFYPDRVDAIEERPV
jgi:uncharacterized protein (DUF427 family)